MKSYWILQHREKRAGVKLFEAVTNLMGVMQASLIVNKVHQMSLYRINLLSDDEASSGKSN